VPLWLDESKCISDVDGAPPALADAPSIKILLPPVRPFPPPDGTEYVEVFILLVNVTVVKPVPSSVKVETLKLSRILVVVTEL